MNITLNKTQEKKYKNGAKLFLISDEGLVEKLYDVHHFIHKKYINDGYNYEEIYYNLIKNSHNSNIGLFTKDGMVDYKFLKLLYEEFQTGKKYYGRKINLIPNSKNEIDAILLEDGILYLIEMKKNINIDTSNSKGVFSKLEEIKKIYGDIWNIETMIVGIENTPEEIYNMCKIDKISKKNINIISGVDFCERLEIDYQDIVKTVNGNTNIFNSELINIFNNFKI